MTQSIVSSIDAPGGAGVPAVAGPRRVFSRWPAITVERLLWAILLLAAVVTRFWDLGSRALHHDESLHAYYSWGFATGEIPYVHNPLMHGPFLFHANALIYQLFGVSDATSRFVPAAFGVLLVWLPWLLRGRQFLGPWGALATGYLLLLSPAFLYYTRYLRHDPYTAAGALLLAIAVFRYLERPQRRWMLLAFAMVAFLLTNHEIVFAIVLAMVLVLWGALVWTRLRALLPVHVIAVVLAGVDYVLFKNAAPWPAIPWETASAAETRHFYTAILTHPFVIGLVVVGIVFLVGCGLALRWQAGRAAGGGSMHERLFGDAAPNTVAYGVYHALKDPVGLGIGVLVALGLCVTLFTTVFTNLHGLATATYAPDGTLLYWLGQQDVRRGEQPWFYFLTEGFQYEWLGIVVAVAGTILTGLRLVRGLVGRETGPNLLFHVFNAVWFVFLFLVLSWAGEKMPWLIMHFALPGFLIGGALINEIVDGAVAWFASNAALAHRRRWRLGMLGTVGVLVMLAWTWFLLGARLTYGQWHQGAPGVWARVLPRWAITDWWLLAWPPVVALVVIGVAVWLLGARRAAYATVTAAFVVMSLFQVHQGFRLAFLEGDVARDTMIYNTTAPDVTRLADELTAMSRLIDGDNRMEVVYDGCTQWPLNWYLRDLPNRRMMSVPPDDEGQMPPVIIGVPAEWDGRCSMPKDIDGYTAQTYVLRWHEPEQAIYREFAIAPELPAFRSAWGIESNPHDLMAIGRSIRDSVAQATTREGQQRLFRLVLYRELPEGLNPYSFRVFIRNDMLPYYNEIRYGE